MTGDEYGARQDSTSFPEAAPSGGPEDRTAPIPRVGRPARDPLALEIAAGTADGDAPRVVELVVGDCRLTLNSVDGSEVSALAPGDLPAPVRRTAWARAALTAAGRPAVPPGPRAPELPLLERQEERERLVRLLTRGRSVRVTGPSGAGRSVLLDAVAEACADLAPDGVIRLSGYRRTSGDLLQEMFATVYDAEDYRPDRRRLLELLRDVGAVVVLDDLEFGGAALEELLAAAPECAFLMSATPDVPAPAADSAVEEVFLPGLTRVACLELLELAVGRPPTEEETAWAADLWFESEGLPLRFVQAGALLRQRDALGAELSAADESVWGDAEAVDGFAAGASSDDAGPGASAAHLPLPSLAESAAPAALLASRLGASAQEALRFAVALGGELPHQAHLPALVGDTRGDSALGEIVAVGLAAPVAGHHRLAAGVARQLALADGLAAEAAAEGSPQALAAAQHYAWWAGHPSVTPRRVAAEAEAILAALGAARDGGHTSAAVLLARTVAPVLAAAMHWSAWERALRLGQEAARHAGEVAEEAYFLHELGVLALCQGNLDRARSELEASIALRGALADRQGSTVGRRTLALAVDREGGLIAGSGAGGAGAAAAGVDLSEAPTTIIAKSLPGAVASPSRVALTGSRRRNLVAAGAGTLLAAVLGTVVALGTTASGGGQNTPMNVKPVESAQEDDPDEGLPSEETPSAGSGRRTEPPASGSGTATPGAPSGGTTPGDTTRPGGAGSVSGGATAGTGDGGTGDGGTGDGGTGDGGSGTGGGSSTGGTGGGSSTGGSGAGSSTGGSGGGSHGGSGGTSGGTTGGGGTTSGGDSGGTGTPTGGGTSGSPTTTPSDPTSPPPTTGEPGGDGGAEDGGTTEGGADGGGTTGASAPVSSATGTELPGGTTGTIA
ncbi:ATP-binding protein [Actinacidiphila sp. bgisy167]|uniref:ATP-binding protein n=1 Tax=Actinacidiphila sp. bgisy167 TaxID=3413797 RepID=UPI003D72A193